MKVLVANLGSTSFKYRLFDMTDERQLARGGIERIGAAQSACFVEINGQRQDVEAHVPDHAVAVRQCLDQLTQPDTGSKTKSLFGTMFLRVLMEFPVWTRCSLLLMMKESIKKGLLFLA